MIGCYNLNEFVYELTLSTTWLLVFEMACGACWVQLSALFSYAT